MRRRASLRRFACSTRRASAINASSGVIAFVSIPSQFFDDRVRRGAEQGELIHGSGWRRPRPGSAGKVLALQPSKNRPCPRDDRLRQTGETSDVDAVRTVCAARLQPVQKQDLIARLAHRDVVVLQRGELFR